MCDFRNSTSVFYFIRIVVNIVVVIIIILLLSATKMFESGQEQTLYCSAFSSVPRPVFEITLVLGKKTKSPKIPTHHSNYYYYYSKPHSSNISAFSRRTARSDILKTLSLFLSQSMLFVSWNKAKWHTIHSKWRYGHREIAHTKQTKLKSTDYLTTHFSTDCTFNDFNTNHLLNHPILKIWC